MTTYSERSDAESTGGRAWPVLLGAIAFFGVLSMLPVILPALHLQLHPTAPTSSYGVRLMVAPRHPHSVHVPQVARPIDPGQPPTTPPTANQARESATVSGEDKRLRVILHDAARIYQPEVIPVRGALPTLVLTAGGGTYTAATLVQYGALVMLPHHAALLLDNVYVSTNASLTLGGPNLRTLYLDSGSGGFATIVAWGGNLSFKGTATHPMTIMGWDRSTTSPAADTGFGRPYIREAGGEMTLANVRASALGFWSGRTGGVAWTGLSGKPSTGGAASSTFTDDTYGAFVSRGSGVTFRDDLFEFNQLDGLHIHRYSLNTSVVSSSASRNGGNGFVVSPAAENTVLENDISEHNAGNGYFLNGRPLATGASASGGSVAPGVGTRLEYSAALNNGKMGVLVEGGTGTVLKGNQVCAGVTAIAIRNGASDAVLTGNTVGCDPRSGFSIGPSTPGIMLAGNAVDDARMGFLIRNSGPVQFDRNLITRATVFGISARGTTSSVSGVDNTISGTGFRAIDARADAPAPSLYNTNLAGWAFHVKVTFWSYLEFHPLAAMWLGILVIVLLAWVVTRMRRMPLHPYLASTHWRGEVESAATAAAAADVRAARHERQPVAAGHRADPPLATAGTAVSPAIGTAAPRQMAPAEPAGFGALAEPARPARLGTHRGFGNSGGPGNPAADPGKPAGYVPMTGSGESASRFDSWNSADYGVPSDSGNGRFGERPDSGRVTDLGTPDEAADFADIPTFYRAVSSFGGADTPDEPGAVEETVPERAESSTGWEGASRPPWVTAPMPELEAESRAGDRFGAFSPWEREVDPQ